MDEKAQTGADQEDTQKCRDAKVGGMLIGGLVGAVAGVYIVSNTKPVLGITMGIVSLEDILIPILTTSVGYFGGMFIGRVAGCYDN
ncbi:MAG: hypothetical protein HY581_07795 [Nitrospirae bacterium]|nr:hypothetical protein [Nitrospirota bacterium]